MALNKTQLRVAENAIKAKLELVPLNKSWQLFMQNTPSAYLEALN